MKRLVIEPLFHFLLLGGAIFVGYSLITDDIPGQNESILVTRNSIDNLVVDFERSWLRTPTNAELDGLVEDYIREEVAVREAVMMGLDLNDSVIRRLLRRKFEFVATDLASRSEPEESELKDYLNMHPEQFRSQSRFTFRHIYFSPQRHGASLREDIENLVVTLNSDKGEVDAGSLGDVTSLEPEFSALTQSDMAQIFGETFSFEVGKLEVGRWSGPVTSEFGLHLVLVDAVQPGEMPAFELVRDDVRRELLYARSEAAIDQIYQQLLQRYTVTVEPMEGVAQSSLLAAENP